MKFTIVVVMLALGMSANASVLPLSLGISSPWGSSLTFANPWASSLALGSPLISSPLIASPQVLAPRAIALSQGITHSHLSLPVVSAPVPVAAPLIAAVPEANYVAATRGAVHVAPLPGHIQSVSSSNLEPAPGTL